MAVEVTIPRLGWNMDEGIFVGWLKENGEVVTAGDPLFSLEGDKSTQEIESLESGILHIQKDGPKPGQTLAVGTVIGYLLEAGESLPDPISPSNIGNAHLDRPEENRFNEGAFASEVRNSTRSTRPRVSPRARRVADELGIDWTKLRGSGRSGRIRERDVRAAVAITKGSGSDIRSKREQLEPQPSQSNVGFEFDVLPVSTIRKAIAKRMKQSNQSTAPVTLTTSVDATNLVNLRSQFKAAFIHEKIPTISYSDVILTLSAIAISKHRQIIGQWAEDRILLPKSIHIGIAVDTEMGLVVPVIRDVNSLTLRQVAARSSALIDAARRGTLSIADSQGSVLTVTNLGAFGIDAFTPIINPPECAILGIGRIRSQVVAVGDRFVSQAQITLSLTFDHRVIDGAPAARFLQTLGAMIENPSPWLLR
jgi:pyruvate dehydrogenase E2 component (dihydrolipoamide acetyltransferase)